MKRILFLILILQPFIASSQLEASIWYFGNKAGLDFRSGSPVALNNSAMHALEGCSSLADSIGNLLLYTDGATVWDRSGNIMSNGNNVGGGVSATQSCLIVANPSKNGIYYIFTTDENLNQGMNGLRYSTVDISANSGNGVVTQKNDSLYGPILEKLTGTIHQNGHDVWVIAHKSNSNEFVAYLVTNTGVSPAPVISTVGNVYTVYYGGTGQMKVSPDGKKIAHASFNAGAGAALYKFNNATGVVTDPVHIADGAYGIEFSPDNSKIYVNSYNNVKQYHIVGGWDSLSIAQSMTTIADQTTGFQSINALQLAIDGKIYVSRTGSKFVSAITRPNNLGRACNFKDTAVLLGNSNCQWGLPNFIQSYFSNLPTSVAQLQGQDEVYIFPAPARSNSLLTVKGVKSEATFCLYNMLGVVVHRSTINAADSKVKLGDIPTGQYAAVIVYKNGERSVRKISLIE